MLKAMGREIWSPYTVGMQQELALHQRTKAIVSLFMYCSIIPALAMRMRRYRVR